VDSVDVLEKEKKGRELLGIVKILEMIRSDGEL